MIEILAFLSGGTGTPKLLQGFMEILPQDEISVIVNTGEDVYVSGLRVSPDLDTVTYTLAGLIDDEKWYGVRDDTFYTHEMLDNLGHEEILKIGDKDRAIKLYRTFRMDRGATLTRVTSEICKGLNVKAEVLPMSNDRVETRISTPSGKMPFHKYWVERGARDEVKDVEFLGSGAAEPAPGVVKSLDSSDFVIIGPSNPITSVGPILAVEKIRLALRRNSDKVLAVSPVLGDAPVSGPTGDLMKGLGHEVNPPGVADIYRDIASLFLLHEEDRRLIGEIEKLGMKAHSADILVPDLSSRIRLAKKILDIIDY